MGFIGQHPYANLCSAGAPRAGAERNAEARARSTDHASQAPSAQLEAAASATERPSPFAARSSITASAGPTITKSATAALGPPPASRHLQSGWRPARADRERPTKCRQPQ
jgi:hypothetical protein